MTFAARTLGFSRSTIIYTFGGNTTNVSFNVTSGSAPPGTGSSVVGTYVAGNTDIKIVIGNGVYVYSTAVGTAALTLTGGSGTDKIELTNNGYIMGCGGTGGGSTGTSATYLAPTAGGTALKAGFALTVINASTRYIAGGGGGGGGGSSVVSGAGGAGGGSGGTATFSTTLISGGGPGAPGGSGTAGTTATVGSYKIASGGGGGRTLPGTASGTVSVTNSAPLEAAGLGGSAGGGGAAVSYNTYGGGGGGGGYGASGGNGLISGSWIPPSTGGNGGFAGNAGTAATVGAGSSAFTTNTGALGGKGIDFNGFSVTVSNSGTIYGGQS